MKKLLSALLGVMILFALFPVRAVAAERNTSEYNELIELACEIFPEYVLAIRGGNSSRSTYSQSGNQIIYQETREISDTESLGISMLASGEVIIVKNNSSGQLYLTVTDSSTSDINTVGVSGSATFEVGSSTWNYFFKLSDVRYTIYYTGSDYFTNFGSPYYQALHSVDVEEESTTRIAYCLHVTANYTQFHTFELYFQNNRLVADVA